LILSLILFFLFLASSDFLLNRDFCLLLLHLWFHYSLHYLFLRFDFVFLSSHCYLNSLFKGCLLLKLILIEYDADLL